MYSTVDARIAMPAAIHILSWRACHCKKEENHMQAVSIKKVQKPELRKTDVTCLQCHEALVHLIDLRLDAPEFFVGAAQTLPPVLEQASH